MEQKRFDKMNLVVIAVVVVVVIAAAAFVLVQRQQMASVPQNTAAYLVVQVAGQPYMPIKLEGDDRYTITRGDMVNTIAVTPTSIRMHESSCDNQDCVLQGEVTLENRSKRVLQHMILCLPNEVVLELLTEEEARRDYPNAFMTEETNE